MVVEIKEGDECSASSPSPAHMKTQGIMLQGGHTWENQTWILPPPLQPAGTWQEPRGGPSPQRGFRELGASQLRPEPG